MGYSSLRPDFCLETTSGATWWLHSRIDRLEDVLTVNSLLGWKKGRTTTDDDGQVAAGQQSLIEWLVRMKREESNVSWRNNFSLREQCYHSSIRKNFVSVFSPPFGYVLKIPLHFIFPPCKHLCYDNLFPPFLILLSFYCILQTY